jgi:hypothetical protein
MTSNKPSRRHLLAGFLDGLTAWLCPRLTHADTLWPAPPVDVPPHPYGECLRFDYDWSPVSGTSVTYAYDASGRLLPSAEHPSRLERE